MTEELMHIAIQKESTPERTFSLWGQSGRKQGQAVWRCFAVSIPRDTEKEIRHCPGHPAPLQQRSWKRSQGVLLHFSHPVILWNITWRISVCSDLIWVVGCRVPRIPQLWFMLMDIVILPQWAAEHHTDTHSVLCSWNGGQNWKRKSARTGGLR